MKVLLIGSGAREHALAWKLRQSPSLTHLYIAPGNPGMASLGTLLPDLGSDVEATAEWARISGIDLTIVGPEEPLSRGIVDELRARGLRAFGPTRAAAMLEASKEFSKAVMREAHVPTPASTACRGRAATEEACRKIGAPLVLKADGLASGKGVVVCRSEAEVEHGLHYLFEVLHADIVLVEEFIKGVEASFIVATDGQRIVPFATSHDYKRIHDGNAGANTGGMGSLSPTPYLDSKLEAFVLSRIISPVIARMAERGTPFTGFLYAGLMIPDGGDPVVIEFNARFGDPECQAVMRRLDTDLLTLLYALTDHASALPDVQWSSSVAACVVHAAEGYPGTPTRGDVITGVDQAHEVPSVVVFQAGTALQGDTLVTSGGRVLSVTALASTVPEALELAYRASDRIQFRGRQLRRDIGGPNG
jgi:phosphoribosylamine---glycine ligase